MSSQIKGSSLLLVIFVITSAVGLAGGYIKKGQTFKAEEDVRYFTQPESVRLLEQLNELEALKKQIVIYQENERLYKEAIKEKDLSIESYKESITLLKMSIDQYKSIIDTLKLMSTEQAKTVVELNKALSDTRASSSRQKRVNFFTGFIAPIAGAWGLSRIK